MQRPLLVSVGLFVCALLVGGAWFVTRGDGGGGNSGGAVLAGPDQALTPTNSGTDRGGLQAPDLGARSDAARADRGRDEVETAPTPAEVVDPRASVPKDVIWIEGRVVEPDGLPPGDRMYVAAKGRSFHKNSERREHEVAVKDDGTFRVALAKGTRLGWLTVRSRFAYLEDAYKVKPRDLEEQGEIVLEPVLGGVIRGEVEAPLELAWTKEPLRGGRAEIMRWSGGTNVTQYEDLNGSSTFEFHALPPGDYETDWISVRTDFLQRGTPEEDFEVKPGQVTDLRIAMNSGARIFGTILDDRGEPVVDPKIELRVIVGGNEWGAWRDRQQVVADEVDSEGRFAFYGVRPGVIRLEGTALGYRDATVEVGRLEDGEQRVGVEIVLDRGRSISGHVRWPDGRPAVGALVKLEQESDDDDWSMWETIPAVKTDENGDFLFRGLTVDGSCRVVASLRPPREEIEGKDGRVRKSARRPHAWRARADKVQPGSADLRLTLDSGAAVRGRVVDDVGEPVTRFHVTAMPVDREMSRIDWETRTGTTVLGGDGSFQLEGVQEGEWTLVVAAHDHIQSEPHVFRIPHDGSEVTVVCPRSAKVKGIVRGPSGDPVYGADVRIASRASATVEDQEVEYDDWSRSAETNSRGEFELEDIQHGAARIVADHDDFAASDPVEVTVQAGQVLEGVDLRLRVGARLRVELHAAAGDLGGRSVRVNQRDGDYWGREETDSGGVAVFEGLNEGTYEVSLSAPDSMDDEHWMLRNAAEDEEVVEVGRGGTARVVLGAPPENPIVVRGTVTRDGAGVAGAIVGFQGGSANGPEVPSLSSVAGFQNPSRGSESYATRTSAAGNYELSLAFAGDYAVTVTTNGSSKTFHCKVVPGESGRFDFDLPTMTLSGMITTPDGVAATDIDVSLQRVHAPGDEEGTIYDSQSNETGEDGRYRFENLSPGTYTLRVGQQSGWGWGRRGPRYAQATLTDLVIEDGKSLPGVDVQLELPGTIRGVVYGSDGEPLQGAWVESTDSDGASFGGSANSISGPGGRFVLRGLPAGTVRVVAREGEDSSEEVEVKVYAEQDSDVELRIR